MLHSGVLVLSVLYCPIADAPSFPCAGMPPLCCPKGQRTAGIFRFMAHPEREGTVFYESFFISLRLCFVCTGV